MIYNHPDVAFPVVGFIQIKSVFVSVFLRVTFNGWIMKGIFTYYSQDSLFFCVQTNLWLFNWPEVFFQRLVSASLASSSSMLTVSSGCSPKCLIVPSAVFLSSSLQVDYGLDNVMKWARFLGPCLRRQSSILTEVTRTRLFPYQSMYSQASGMLGSTGI